MYSVVLWDIDNTLLDFDYAEEFSIRETFGIFSLGNVTAQMINAYREINNFYWQQLELGKLSKDRILVARFEDFFEMYNIDKSVASDFDTEYEKNLGHYVRFKEGGLNAVKSLKGKVIQCAVTNGCEAVQRTKLQKSGLDTILDAVYISDVIGFEKPSPGFFEPVFKDWKKISKEKFVIIGDSLSSDIAGAFNAGIDSVWYNPGHRKSPDVCTYKHETDSLEEASRFVLQGIC